MKKIIFILFVIFPLPLFAENSLTLPNISLRNDLIERGSGEFRRFGFHVYDAKLWTMPSQNTPPYALQLKYSMRIKSNKIVEASIKEMKSLGVSEELSQQWKAHLFRIIPSVTKGDVITGINTGVVAVFYLNDTFIGVVDSDQFATDFFGIWLSPQTNDKKFRKNLLQQ